MYIAEHKNKIKKNKDETQKQETNEHSCLAWLEGLFEPVSSPSALRNPTKLMQIIRKIKYSKGEVRSGKKRLKGFPREAIPKSHRSCL